ncbi:antitoxin [Corynebacterium poyangense]|uniref:Antitoxin n=1 Tax=Corynebacterium poyangense TaxID=2684405 RepID=A0A7H0SQ45_9CORY|nr:antitoxin [Corynebacterium poyangense]MBZ8178394.1 antitoxin [Corynebacterium poyangense]QNQ90670.1 antitoxin [Corynebacterium poyangense]
MGLVDKAKEFLNSDKGHQATDQALDHAEQAATQKFGEDKADQIHKVRDQIDQRLGGGDDAPAESQQ